METNPEEAEKRHQNFITDIVKNKTVWGLTTTKRWATSSSSFFKKVEVMPFWSEENLAISCAKDQWKGYLAGAIPLGEFLENWCAGLYEDHFLAGTNWTADLIGKELEPLDLIIEIIDEIKKQKTEVKLEHFESLEHLEEQVRDMIEDE